MSKDRTSISVTKELKRELDDVKLRPEESYEDELWRLIDFYRSLDDRLSDMGNSGDGANGDGDLDELQAEVEKLEELVEKVPENAAEIFERKYGSH